MTCQIGVAKIDFSLTPVESQFLEPPKEMKIGSGNLEFEKVASTKIKSRGNKV